MAATVTPEVAPKDGAVRAGLRETGDLTVFSAQSLAAIPGSLNYISEAMRHTALMMRGSLPLVFILNVFLGVTVANFAFFLLRAIGAGDFLGLITGYADPRQTATTMFGYIFTAKVCCGMAAELGAMKIQQEVDAYDSTGVDPIRYLVGTRMIAVLLFVPVATVVSLLGQIAGSYLLSVVIVGGISGNVLMSVHWSVQTIADQLFTLVTIGSIAVSGALVACFYGLRTVGGPAAVGRSVAKSLVVNLVLLHVIAAAFAVVVYGLDAKLPIGG